MHPNNDQIFRDKLKSAEADDLFNDFDEQIVWTKIQQRMPSAVGEKKFSFLFYWPYAAVLLVGILLGRLFLPADRLDCLSAMRVGAGQQQEDKPPVEVRKTETISRVTTPVVVKHPKAGHHYPVMSSPPVQESEEGGIKKNDSYPPVEVVNELVTVAAETKDEIRVVYYDDVMITEKKTTAFVPGRKKKKLLQVNMPKSNEASSPEPPIRNLMYAFKQ